MTSFQQLTDIVKKLRGPNGCPWDKAQTHKTLTPFAIEESFELEQAIENGDVENIKEELGDLLFQTVLHAQIASDENNFNIDDVIKNLNEKMIRRHPHVFSDVKVKDQFEVLKNWEEIKSEEKKLNNNISTSVFDIPKTFPALLRAQKIGKKTQKLDFDWTSAQEVSKKVEEELLELKEAVESKVQKNIEEEMGDLLFTVVQWARHLHVDAEKSLRQANDKFTRRFENMLQEKEDFLTLPRDEKEKLWNLIKSKEV